MSKNPECPLMRSPGTFKCANCFYFDVENGQTVCGRRGRAMRWNPLLFFCGEYGTTDTGEITVPFSTTLDLWR